jgi:hypothetical protein
MGDSFGEKLFQEYRAWPRAHAHAHAHAHTVIAVLDVLNENTDKGVLSNHFPEQFEYGWSWSPYSPDFNPHNYFLWAF